MNPSEALHKLLLTLELSVLAYALSSCAANAAPITEVSPTEIPVTADVTTRAFCQADSTPAVDVSVHTSLPANSGIILTSGYQDAVLRGGEYAASDGPDLSVVVTGLGSIFDNQPFPSNSLNGRLFDGRPLKLEVFPNDPKYLTLNPYAKVVVELPHCN